MCGMGGALTHALPPSFLHHAAKSIFEYASDSRTRHPWHERARTSEALG